MVDRPIRRVAQKIAVVTVARSDYGILRPLLRELAAASDLQLLLIVAGNHRSKQSGETISEIVADGFEPAFEVSVIPAMDDAASMAKSMATHISGLADAFNELCPDMVVLLGDRYEMHGAAATVAVMGIPILHIAGGAISRGAIDDLLRNSISKLGSIHFPETQACGLRLQRMGEEKWRIHVVGALGLDNVRLLPRLTLDAINAKYGLALGEDFLLVTFHPVTRETQAVQAAHADAFFQALEDTPYQMVVTYPNADAGSGEIIARQNALAARHAGRIFSVPHLGTEAYFSLMARARAMVGNSSSGIVEAVFFKLPVVNVGRRQEGREAPANVIHVDCAVQAIRNGIARALSPEFRAIADAAEESVRRRARGRANIASYPFPRSCRRRLADQGTRLVGRTVLFLNAGRRVELLEAFRRELRKESADGRIVATDVQTNAPAWHMADMRAVLPHSGSPDFINKLKQLCRNARVDLIVPLIDPDLPILAVNRPAIEESGSRVLISSPDTIRICRDKALTGEFLLARGLPGMPVFSLNEARQAAFPLIVKPRDGSASINVFEARTPAELDFFFGLYSRPDRAAAICRRGVHRRCVLSPSGWPYPFGRAATASESTRRRG